MNWQKQGGGPVVERLTVMLLKQSGALQLMGSLGISRFYVSRIEKKAVEKLRVGMECLG